MAENHHPAHFAPPRRWRGLLAWAVLTLVLTGFYWRLVLTDQYTWLAGPDLAYQVLPWYQFQAGEWQAGRLPLWDPYLWSGQPLAGQAQPGVFYPLNWLLYALPLRNGWLKPTHLHWYFVFIHLLAGWFAYWLARDLRMTRAAAILSGLVFSLAGWLGTNDWPQMINGAVWAPLIFLFVFRALRGERVWRSAALGGLFLGMAWLSGHHQIPIFLSLAAGGVWLWQARRNYRLLAPAVLFFAIAVMISAPQVLAAMEYGKLSIRWVGASEPIGWERKVPYSVHSHFGLQVISLLGVVFPGMCAHSDPHVGVAALLLALLGAALAWKRMEARRLAALGLGAVLFSLAQHTPFHGFLYSVAPLVDKARSPSMAIFVFGFAVAMLAGFGLDALLRRRRHAWVARAGQAALWFGVAALGMRLLVVFQTREHAGIDYRPLVTMLSALLLAALVAAWRRGALRAGVVALCCCGLFLTEIANTNSFYQPNWEEKERVELLTRMQRHGDAARFLRTHPGLRRVMVDDAEVPHNFGDWFGVFQSGGYLASITSNFKHFEAHSDAGLRLLGVEFALRKEPWGAYQEKVFESRDGLRVYRRADSLPRAFAVHEVAGVADVRRTMAELVPREFELERRAFVIGPAPRVEPCEGTDVVEIAHYDASRVRLEARMACRGMVVLTDLDYPGWQVTVDGRKAEVLNAYGLVRGVVVDAGTHSIEFRYRPWWLWAGAALAGLALVIVGVLFVRRVK